MTMWEQWSSLHNEVNLHPSMQMALINSSTLQPTIALNHKCIATALSTRLFCDFNDCISKPLFPSQANRLLPLCWFIDSSYHYNLLGFSMAILHECLPGCKRTAGLRWIDEESLTVIQHLWVSLTPSLHQKVLFNEIKTTFETSLTSPRTWSVCWISNAYITCKTEKHLFIRAGCNVIGLWYLCHN